MPPCARMTDNVICLADIHQVPPIIGGPTPFPVTGMILGGATETFVSGLPMARMGDSGVHAACPGRNSFDILTGSTVAFHTSAKPIARMGDTTKHCGEIPPSTGGILGGAFTVIVG